MTGKDHGHLDDAPDARQGLRFDGLTPDQRSRVLGDAFDYRGDVTLTLDDGTSISGYVFAVEPSPKRGEPHLRLLPPDPAASRMTVPLARITGCTFSGRDTADGRSWEAWVRRWEEKRRLIAQGVDVGDIEPQAESLD